MRSLHLKLIKCPIQHCKAIEKEKYVEEECAQIYLVSINIRSYLERTQSNDRRQRNEFENIFQRFECPLYRLQCRWTFSSESLAKKGRSHAALRTSIIFAECEIGEVCRPFNDGDPSHPTEDKIKESLFGFRYKKYIRPAFDSGRIKHDTNIVHCWSPARMFHRQNRQSMPIYETI